MSRVGAAALDLRNHWRFLERQWQITSDLWRDSVRDRFEREFWDELEKTAPATLDAMEALDEVMESARRAVR